MAASTFTNKLGEEKSPYLLQHKHNPIEWYPWGSEAFEKAKSMNRLIFLSVGYSTCHWCHVMERESFENEDVAKILNDNFVSIKVDREERPDVDKLYMSFVQALTGSGGWPMSVFLTPELDPFFGGTYFPPNDNYGRPGFKSILNLLNEKWVSDPNVLSQQGKSIMEALGKGLYSRSELPPVSTIVNGAFQYKLSSFDKKYGGFGTEPKFPKPVDLEFLLHFYSWSSKEDKTEHKLAYEMLERTLDAMQLGGIHDHVGKGFHRYSVDAEWHVPHFEKMLYDQTQLLSLYADFNLVAKGKYSRTVKDIAEYMLTYLHHPSGGFYAAEDADSLPTEKDTKKKEGAFCVWTRKEVEHVLGDASGLGVYSAVDLISEYFDVQQEGNVPQFMDPHGELTGCNVLRMRKSHEEYAKQFGVTSEELQAKIDELKSALLSVRALRPAPHLDSKMVTAWQGLAIGAFAKASVSLGDENLLRVAEQCVEFVKTNCVNEKGELIRAVYRGEDGNVEQNSDHPVLAFSDDYALLIQGLLDVCTVNGDVTLLRWAEQLQEIMDSKFWDSANQTGYFISEEDAGGVKIRIQEDQDGAEPCANSVSVSNLVRLSELFDAPAMKERAVKIVEGASQRLVKYPHILPKMISPFKRIEDGNVKIVLVGDFSQPLAREMRDSVLRTFILNASIVQLDVTKDLSYLHEKCPFLIELNKQKEATVYICEGTSCGLPITSPEQLKSRLEHILS